MNRHQIRPVGAVVLTVALIALLAACEEGGDDDQAAVDAEVEAIADQTEAKGWLRPIFPSYVLPGLDQIPVVFEGSETTVSFNYPPLDDAEPSDEPRPFDLAIAQNTVDQYDFCPLEDDDPDFACVEIGDVQGKLQTTDQGDGMVDYFISFELDDRTVYLEAIWNTGGPLTDESDQFMRGETIRVAESLFDH